MGYNKLKQLGQDIEDHYSDSEFIIVNKDDENDELNIIICLKSFNRWRKQPNNTEELVSYFLDFITIKFKDQLENENFSLMFIDKTIDQVDEHILTDEPIDNNIYVKEYVMEMGTPIEVRD